MVFEMNVVPDEDKLRCCLSAQAAVLECMLLEDETIVLPEKL